LYVYWECPTRNDELRSTSIEARKAFRVHGGRGDNQLEIPAAGENLLDQTHQHISVESAFMSFVHDNA
jgi:hypothetical protein